MLNEEDTDINEALIPGVFSDKKNCIVYYATIVATFSTLLLILIITIFTASVVNETSLLVKDMNELLPQAKMGLRIIDVLCNDKNFTTFHPNYAKVIC